MTSKDKLKYYSPVPSPHQHLESQIWGFQIEVLEDDLSQDLTLRIFSDLCESSSLTVKYLKDTPLLDQFILTPHHHHHSFTWQTFIKCLSHAINSLFAGWICWGSTQRPGCSLCTPDLKEAMGSWDEKSRYPGGGVKGGRDWEGQTGSYRMVTGMWSTAWETESIISWLSTCGARWALEISGGTLCKACDFWPLCCTPETDTK